MCERDSGGASFKYLIRLLEVARMAQGSRRDQKAFNEAPSVVVIGQKCLPTFTPP